MKRHISKAQFQELPPKAQILIFDWQKAKGHCYNPLLDLVDCIKLLRDISRNERKDDGYHGWKGDVLEFDDFIFAWKSEELINDAWFAVVAAIKKHLASAPFLL